MSKSDEKQETKSKVSTARRVFSIIFFVIFLPIIAIVAIFKFAIAYDKKRKFLESENKGSFFLLHTDITKIDIMQGYEFEELVKTIYFYLGYKAEITKKSKDYGADVILTDDSGRKIVVQTKRYSKTVGARSVQEIASARDHYKADEAWVVTNSFFSEAAETLARETDVKLVDRDEFVEDFAKAKVLIENGKAEKDAENIDKTTFDSFGQGEYRI